MLEVKRSQQKILALNLSIHIDQLQTNGDINSATTSHQKQQYVKSYFCYNFWLAFHVNILFNREYLDVK